VQLRVNYVLLILTGCDALMLGPPWQQVRNVPPIWQRALPFLSSPP
jgi:hypothetical protein